MHAAVYGNAGLLFAFQKTKKNATQREGFAFQYRKFIIKLAGYQHKIYFETVFRV